MSSIHEPVEKLIGEVVALRLSLRTLSILFAHATERAETMASLHETTSKVLDDMIFDLKGLDEAVIRAHAETMVDQVFDDGGVFRAIKRG